ncbi:hypothetical protein C475_14283 [Halosimplex carlsbadense 2-9-1]|uniref:Membrane-spanning protein n=1 Tax=Halosimplex carlsbadense 2-9-1 TaxID=797114 RepID=M0CLD6_9EURY|nr:hypothetical protein [Halosimplex carlsbadense]ELZ23448.1 hypothetical protein C475_14283 [Halosimplex carlsbadense 2-9-1]
MRIRDRLGITARRQRQLTWLMELVMFGIFLLGVWKVNVKIIANAGVALLIAQLVPALERDYGVPLDAGLTLWITSAVFLHAFGTIGIPGGESFYQSVWWWDHMTHALSSSVIAGVGYATVRALDEHSDQISLPPRFVFVFILLFVLAYGVFWEILEFTIGQVAALLGTDSVLTQYGLEDSLWDLIYNTLGAVVVATWGTAHLNGISKYIEERFEQRAA